MTRRPLSAAQARNRGAGRGLADTVRALIGSCPRALACIVLVLSAGIAPAQTPPGVTRTEKTIISGGVERFYTVVTPNGLPPRSPAVVVLHGGGQNMRAILEPDAPQFRWIELAQANGFALLVPNGWNVQQQDGGTNQQSWNDLRPSGDGNFSEQDDAGFIAEMLGIEAERLGLDPRAIFVTGSSNGGQMTHRMLIERSDLFAAGVSFIANLPQADIPDPETPRPILLVNGDADPLMPFEGGRTGGGIGEPVRSTIDSVAYFRRVLDAEDPELVSGTPLPDVDPADGTRAVLQRFFSTSGGAAPVVFVRMFNAGHAVPVLPGDPVAPVPRALVGVRCRDLRGIDLAWHFMADFLPPPAADLNGDGAVSDLDLVLFVSEFVRFERGGEPGDAALDFDDSGDVSVNDVITYVDAFLAQQ